MCNKNILLKYQVKRTMEHRLQRTVHIAEAIHKHYCC